MNGPRADWMELFLSARGRLARGPFLACAVVMTLVLSVYEALVTPSLHWLTGWIFYPALVFAGACLLSKRLHDRGRSGWWAAPILAASVAVWPRPEGFWDFLFAVVLFWAVVELGAMSGEPGANRHGPSPSRSAKAAG